MIEFEKMDYWELRKAVSRLVPRRAMIPGRDFNRNKEKGRKSNYFQYDILANNMKKTTGAMLDENRLTVVNVSFRAQSCPMPFNMDVWDGMCCPYACRYCYADNLRSTLFPSFYDNGREVGIRHCAEAHWKAELDRLFVMRGEKVHKRGSAVHNSARLGIPLRFGIQFEDFTELELQHGVSLSMLRYLSKAKYPVMVNTKSDILGNDDYAEALASNKGGAAVHVTLITSNEALLKKIEPGAPTFASRMRSVKALVDAGVRVVGRIEPWMIFNNDVKEDVEEYVQAMKRAGVKHLTLDSYSYSAYNPGIRDNFHEVGIDFDRMFLLSADSQWLSSLLLGKFMKYLQGKGFKCSTFDQGNVPDNDDWICCSVGDYFLEKGAGMNWGCGTIAVKLIQGRGSYGTTWGLFDEYVRQKGGWLSDGLKTEVKKIWNGEGDMAWPLFHARGLVPMGSDADGLIWTFNPDEDFRMDNLRGGLIDAVA